MATVTVGCKLPNGLIIQVGNKSHTLKGANDTSIVGGHGITEGVDKELWDAWLVANKDRAMVKNGHVFAHGKTESTKAEATEKTSNKTKLEPIDPSKEMSVSKA